jgi:hypothetical protein
LYLYLQELTLQFGKDREVLHVQLNEANAKLAMAAEALRISGQQTQEITNLEHQVWKPRACFPPPWLEYFLCYTALCLWVCICVFPPLRWN